MAIATPLKDTYIVTTLSHSLLRKLNSLVGESAFQRSELLRSWVDNFTAKRDFLLPAKPGRQTWPGQNGERPAHRVTFLISKAAKDKFRERAETLRTSQTLLLRAWIEAFCDGHPCGLPGPSRSPRAQDSELGDLVKPKVPAELKASFGALCRKSGRNPNKVVERWLLALACGDESALPAIATAPTPIAKTPADQALVGMRLRLPRDARARAMAASGAQGRSLSATIALWMQACTSATSCLPSAPQSFARSTATAAAGHQPAGKRDAILEIKLSPALKKQFVAKCDREGRNPSILARAWLAAYRHGKPLELSDAAAGGGAADLAEGSETVGSAAIRVAIAKVDLQAVRSMAQAGSISRLVRGWIRGYVASP